MKVSRSARLAFKKAFVDYLLDVLSANLADPSSAFAACESYLEAMRVEIGPDRFFEWLEKDLLGLAGEVEQDISRLLRLQGVSVFDKDLSRLIWERLKECIEVSKRRRRL